MEFDVDRLRDIYGLGGGLGLAASMVVGEAGWGILGERLGERLSPVGTLGSDTISRPNSSVNGRGGGRSTMASKSCKNHYL